jgi:glycosyltransferase involved in cell wall biosynthesis
VTARYLDSLVDVYLAPTRAAARRLANLEAVPDKIALAPAAAVLRPDDPEYARRLASDKNRRNGQPRVLFHGPADVRRSLGHQVEEIFTAEALERADVVVLAGAADPTLALDAMAFGCLVIAVGGSGLDEIVIHDQTGLAVDPGELRATLAEAASGRHAPLRDSGCELALATSWEPAARALLDALAAARTRLHPVAGTAKRSVVGQ